MAAAAAKNIKNGAEGFLSVEDIVSQKWASVLLNTAAHNGWPLGGDTRLMSLLAPIGSLDLAKLAATNWLVRIGPFECFAQVNQV